MKTHKWLKLTLFILIICAVATGVALAEDGGVFKRNVSKTPELQTGKASVFMMDFYVPAQAANGVVGPVDNYLLADGTTEAYLPRNYAKPLISVYIDKIDGHEELLGNELMTGVTFGAFDSFVSYSLDDGNTWRIENISRHADLSSFTLRTGEAFPGMSHGLVHQVAEDKILMVWASKFCDSGFPLYSWVNNDSTDYTARLDLLASDSYLPADESGNVAQAKNPLYLYDLFGVSGNQGSVDFTEIGFPEVGEVPYSCIWSARGKLIAGDDPKTAEVEASHVVWMSPERLTSAVRDANLPAVDCAGGAGCAVTWQEDPEGLRPGKGLGPGLGWSGAIVNAKTDIWYSYINFNDFDYVVDDAGDPILIEEYEALAGGDMDRPKPYVPMAIPVRLTDNELCRVSESTGQGMEDPYCYIDFSAPIEMDNLPTAPSTSSTFCATNAQWESPGGNILDICITQDGRWLVGRVGASRVRMALKPYTLPDGTKSAWLSMGVEELKALGITADKDTEEDPVDIGKNMWYYSFDFAQPYQLSNNPTLGINAPAYIVQQGGMLNQPAVCTDWFPTSDEENDLVSCPAVGEFYDTVVEEDPPTGYEYYLTEISRRFALAQNGIGSITDPSLGGAGLSGMLIFKQGIIWQGGPADIMLRRTLIDEPICTDTITEDCFDLTTENPFAFERMECGVDGDGWIYTDGSNPKYLQGLCTAPAINISGTTIVTCDDGSSGDACAMEFPATEDGSVPDTEGDFNKVLEWRNCDGVTAIDGCDNTNDPGGDLDDQSWENPYDIAKGHRGFLDGDYVMMMYAWSPNWKANSDGNDHYNLYQRRSFDGGVTWTTAPADMCTNDESDYTVCDGVQSLEYYYGDTVGVYVPYLWETPAGEFEQARNLSLLHGNKVTVLDPRYSPTGSLKQYSTIRTDWLEENADLLPSFDDVLPYEDDAVRDKSKYMLIYETGDNTVDYDVAAATPLNLYYGRATDYGDTLEYYDYINDSGDCNPVDGEVDWETCLEPRFPWLENAQDDLSGEASVVLNLGGTFSYQVWNQWQEEALPDGHELIHDSDSIFRRLLYLTDDSTLELAPVAEILYKSHDFVVKSLGGEVTFIGTGRDLDKIGDGVVGYEWTSNIDGLLGTGEIFTAAVESLSNGVHTITFTVLDGEGQSSRPISFTLWVTDSFFSTSLPIVVK